MYDVLNRASIMAFCSVEGRLSDTQQSAVRWCV